MGETSIMATTKICKTNPTKEKHLLTAIFKCTMAMGTYTHIDDVVSHDKKGICDWALLPLCHTVTQEKHVLTGCHCCLEATNDAGR